jgi:hypothetical protein
VLKVPHCNDDPRNGDWSASSPKLTYAEGGRYLRVSFARSPAAEWNQEHFVNLDRSKRGVCKGFSFGSRRRMLDRLNQVSVAAELPAFVAVTFPDQFYQPVLSVMAKRAKAHMDVLMKRLHRACPSACGFWRMEWQSRKSGLHEGKLMPHFHLLIWGLPQRQSRWGHGVEPFIPVREAQEDFAGLCGEVMKRHCFEDKKRALKFAQRSFEHFSRVDDAEHIASKYGIEHTFMTFFDWISLVWYHVVGTGNLDHFRAGCRVEQVDSWRGVASYCSKYMSKADSDNWMSDVPAGRQWGIFNRSCMPWAKLIKIDLDDDVGIRLRRVARHFLEHATGKRVQRHYGMTLYCDTSKFKPLFARPPDTPF